MAKAKTRAQPQPIRLIAWLECYSSIMIAAFLFVAAQGLDVRITYTCPATSTTAVVEQIARQSGAKLEAPRFQDWPVIVSVSDVKLRDFMARLAEVTDSEWIESGERHILTRNAVRIRKAREAELADRVDRLSTWMDANFKLMPAKPWSDEMVKDAALRAIKDRPSLAKRSGFTQSDITYYAFADRSPAEILLHDFIRKFGVARLATATINGRVSYSETPTVRIKLLPFSIGPATEAFRKTRAKFVELANEIPEGEAKVVTQYELQRSTIAEPLRTVFSVYRPNSTANVKVQVTVSDAKGTLIDIAGTSLELSKLPAVDAPAGLDGKVDLAALSREVVLRMTMPSTAPMGYATNTTVQFPLSAPPMSAQLYKQLHQPNKVDPFAYFASDWLHQLAEKRALPLVAYVPDPMFTSLATMMATNLNHADLWKAQVTLGVDISEQGGWLTVRPRMFGRADRYRTNRKAFSDLLKPFEKGIPDIHALAAYAEKMPGTHYSENLDLRLLRLLHPGVNTPLAFPANVEKLLLFKSFSPEQQRGGQIDLRTLTAWQLAVLIDANPLARYGYSFESGLGMSRSGPMRADEFEPYLRPAYVADGFKLDRELALGVGIVQPDGSVFPMSAGSLGVHLGASPENVSGVTLVKSTAKVIPCEIVTYHFSLTQGGGYQRSGLEWYQLYPGAAVSIDSLPKAYLDAVNAAKDAGKDFMFKVSYGSSTVKPPLD